MAWLSEPCQKRSEPESAFSATFEDILLIKLAI